ncbi:hypothetical protein AB0G85_36760 [Streptomyces sioyaensis]
MVSADHPDFPQQGAEITDALPQCTARSTAITPLAEPSQDG